VRPSRNLTSMNRASAWTILLTIVEAVDQVRTGAENSGSLKHPAVPPVNQIHLVKVHTFSFNAECPSYEGAEHGSANHPLYTSAFPARPCASEDGDVAAPSNISHELIDCVFVGS